MTVTPGETFNLGPGSLQIGATGTEVDVSCLINNAVIAADKDQGDSTTKLCGTVVPGSTTYTYTLSGNIDLDIADASGLWKLSQDQAGEQVGFTFVPSTEAGTEATGMLILDPLPFGGDESGQPMAGDFEFSIVGRPTYAMGGDVVVEGSTLAHTVKAAPVRPETADQTADQPTTAPGAQAEPAGV